MVDVRECLNVYRSQKSLSVLASPRQASATELNPDLRGTSARAIFGGGLSTDGPIRGLAQLEALHGSREVTIVATAGSDGPVVGSLPVEALRGQGWPSAASESCIVTSKRPGEAFTRPSSEGAQSPIVLAGDADRVAQRARRAQRAGAWSTFHNRGAEWSSFAWGDLRGNGEIGLREWSALLLACYSVPPAGRTPRRRIALWPIRCKRPLAILWETP